MNDEFRTTAMKKSTHSFISAVASRLRKVENLQSVWDENTFALQDSEVKACATSEISLLLSYLSFSGFTMQQIKVYWTDFAFLFHSRLVEVCFISKSGRD